MQETSQQPNQEPRRKPVAPPALGQGPQPCFTAEDPRDAVAALLRAARTAPDAGVVTVAADGRSTLLPYPELLDRADRVLGGLRRHGARAGDHVILHGLPLPDFFPAFWACLLGGIRPTTIAAGSDGGPMPERLAHTWRLLDRPLIVSDAAGVAALAGMDDSGPDTLDPGGLRVVDVAPLAAAPAAGDYHRPHEDEVALLMLSSGSTGAPKAAELTHRALSEFAAGTRHALDLRPGDSSLNWLPVDHSGALFLYHLLEVFAGCTNVHVPTDLVLAEPLRWLDLMAEHRTNHSWAPMFGYRLVTDALIGNQERGRHWDLAAVRTLVSGGEQITPEAVAAFQAATAPFGVTADAFRPAWGMAETTTGITWGRWAGPADTYRVLRASHGGELVPAGADVPDRDVTAFVPVGRPAPGAALRIVDVDGAPLAERRIGRLQVKSARITVGYANDPEATAAAFTDDGWFETGDLGFLADGELVITGRSKEQIVLHGQNYSCHEIEEAAATADGVTPGAVAACAVPGPATDGERLVVCFATGETAPDAHDRTARAVRESLFTRLRLSGVTVLAVPEEEFPRTDSGKIRRGELRRRALSEQAERTEKTARGTASDEQDAVPLSARPSPVSSGTLPDPTAPGTSSAPVVLDAVRQAVATVLGHQADDLTPFFELGLTSVTLTQVRVRIARTLELDFPTAELYENPTTAALATRLTARLADRTDPASTARTRPGHLPTIDRRIAIIGMAARFPDADDIGEFWENLRAGTDSIRVFGSDELIDAGVPDALRGDPDFRPVAGALSEPRAFDADFFGISRREAELIDPAHRLFLECCYHALEHAGRAGGTGHSVGSRAGWNTNRIGVFAGSGMQLYGHQDALYRDQNSSFEHQSPPPSPARDTAGGDAIQAATGIQPDFLATRVAHRLGLTGPAIGVQTACSTSLVAVHLAIQALLDGDADLALAGAAAVRLPQERGYRHVSGSILSATGRCRPFDAAADGTVGGNGVAAVLLKPLERAIADGDTVHAVILGSAINNDGRDKVGFTAPSATGQSEAIRRALHRADVAAETLSYVEAHGTGTAVGDPIEFRALTQALGADTERAGFCALGSVKGNIGHLDTCAGMAGLIKTVLMLRHRELVPTVGLSQPHPELPLQGSPFTLATELRPWTTADGVPRRAGVSAFGVGGTNAHLILEEAPPARPGPPPAERPNTVVLPLSAAAPESLTELSARLADHLENKATPHLADVAATLALGRPHLAHRRAVVGRTPAELAMALRKPVPASSARLASAAGPTAFVFSGQGDIRPGMAARLYKDFPAARAVLDTCEARHREHTSRGLLAFLLGESSSGTNSGVPFDIKGSSRRGVDAAAPWPTELTQPALYALQAAQVAAWRSLGLEPGLVLGHSVGEYAALHAAGALSLVDGLLLTIERGRLMQGTAPGGMLAVVAEATAARLLAAACDLEVAAVNGPDRHVLAGPQERVRAAAELLEREQVPWRQLAVDRAFHTALMDPVLDELQCRVEQFTLHPLRLPVVTTADAVLRPAGSSLPDGYLQEQARRAVDFAGALATAEVVDCARYLEVGPGRSLSGPGRRVLPHRPWTVGQRGGADDALWPAVAELYEQGVELDWSVAAYGGRRVPLPAYPFRDTLATPAAAPVRQESAAALVSPAPQCTTGQQPERVAEHLLQRVKELTARQLGIEEETVDPTRTFLELGADSLSLMGMARTLGKDYGVRVPVRELFAQADTPYRLTQWIAARSEPVEPAREGGNTPGPESPSMPESRERPGLDPGSGSRPGPELHPLPELPTESEPCVQPAPGPHPVSEPCVQPRSQTQAASSAAPRTSCDFSLYFFGDYPDESAHDKYGLITEAARFADQNGFHTLWLPERHFHSFGALFPNPSVLAAALAARTERVRLHAGSVVLPLHDPLRVAEEWSVVDNLSHGRAGLCVASGWHSGDFVLAPENFGKHRELMYSRLDTVRSLWAGDELRAPSGTGEEVGVRIHPRPIQERPPLFAAVVSNPDSYHRAAVNDLGVVTNLMTQSVEELADNIALYRRTRAEHGLDPDNGRVVVLLHTYLAADHVAARSEALAPFRTYLRSSLSLFNQVTNSLGLDIDLGSAHPDDVDFLLEQAYQRYCDSRALIGSVDSCGPVIERLLAVGVDEVACFVDFGLPTERVLSGLTELNTLRKRYLPGPVPPRLPDTSQALTPASERPRPVPLSPAQRRIWFLEQLHPGRTTYHEPKAIRFDGPLDLDALRGALRRTVDRHPALRSVVRTDADSGDPHLVPHSAPPLDCPVLDRTGAEEEQAVRETVADELREPLDLAAGPLLRARLLRLTAERHILVLVAHHIVFDSMSTQIFTRDLAAYYRAWPSGSVDLPAVQGPDPAPADGADEAEARAAALRYWRDRLADAPELRLPTDRPRPARPSGRGASFTHSWPSEVAAQVRRFGTEQRGTVFTVLLAAVATALSRLSGQDDLVVGTGLTHRPEGTEHAVGMYVETVPLRVDLSGDPQFGGLVRELTASTLDAYEHRGLPFDELVGELNPERHLGRNPLFQVAVEFENAGAVSFAPPRLAATLVDVPSDRAPMDITLYLTHHADGIGCVVEYDTDLFDEDTICRLLDYVDHVLRHALADPGRRLRELPDLTERDREALAARQTPASTAAPACLHELVEEQARLRPDATALVHGSQQLTYGDLDRTADRAAARLRARGIGRGDLVAVCLARGADLVTALLAVLKSGAAYLPLDPELPERRRDFMTRDSAASLLLTTADQLARRSQPSPAPTALMDALTAPDTPAAPAPPTGPADRPRAQATVCPEDLAYCIYTSGSTGRPKGVDVPHRGPVNLLRWLLAEHPPQDTLQWFSPSVDGSVVEIFGTLAAGARLVLIDDADRYDPAAVAKAVEHHGVARLTMPFTPLKYLMETRPSLPSLRTVISAGEPTGSTSALRDFFAAHPHCTLFNLYGPTEGSVCATAHRVDPGDPAPPIGVPVAGVEVRLLDGAGRPVPVGSPGEIHLAGAGVAVGYRNRPRETAAAFLPDPVRPSACSYRTGDLARWRSDGTLQFLGRVDDQVKIRGHRVEPGEIQQALVRLPVVRDAAVAVRPDRDGEPQLVGYVVPEHTGETEGGGTPQPGDLVSQLAEHLPPYLVPRRWVFLAALPVHSSGKLDRARLPEPDEPTTEGIERPAGPLEASLQEIWQAELGGGPIDVTRGFFDLGGHSLTAVRLLHRIRAALHCDVSVADLFRAPTVRGLAALIADRGEDWGSGGGGDRGGHADDENDRCTADKGEGAVVGDDEGLTVNDAHRPAAGDCPVIDTAPTTSAQRRMWRRHLAHGRPEVHTMAMRADLTGPLNVNALRSAFELVTSRHDALRTRIVVRDGEPVQEILAPFALPLPVVGLSDDEAEIATWCERSAVEPFALDRAPLLRLRLGRIAADRWVLLFAAHHAVGDAWSLHVLWREVSEAYTAEVEGRPAALAAPSLQYSEFARRERRGLIGERRAALVTYWRGRLAGAPLDPELPYDRARPQTLSGRGAVHRFRIPADTAERLHQAARVAAGTFTTVLAAGVGLWLSHLCGQDSVVLALSSARRSQPQDQGLVGYVGEAVPVRLDPLRVADFIGLVRHTGERLYEALDHEELPLAEARAAAVPDGADRPVPAVMVTIMSGPASEAALSGLDVRLTPVTVPGTARTEVYLVLDPVEGGVDAAIEYSTDLLDPETVARWAKDLVHVLDESVGHP